MEYSQAEILQTVAMTEMEHLDVRTVTLGLSLRDCAGETIPRIAARAAEKIHRFAGRLVETVDAIGDEFGIRIANKRIAITPIQLDLTARRLLSRLNSWSWTLPPETGEATPAAEATTRTDARQD